MYVQGASKPRRAHEGYLTGGLRTNPTICTLRRIAVPLENKNPVMARETLWIRRAVAGAKINVLKAFG